MRALCQCRAQSLRLDSDYLPIMRPSRATSLVCMPEAPSGLVLLLGSMPASAFPTAEVWTLKLAVAKLKDVGRPCGMKLFLSKRG